MGLPRKRKHPRWTSEMVEITATRDPKDPPERRDCCKPKPKPAPPQTNLSVQTAVEEITTTDGTTVERTSASLACLLEENEIPRSTEETEAVVSEAPVEGATTDEPPSKRMKLCHDSEMNANDEKKPDFKETWGSKKRAASPNSSRNKDMLWSLIW
ncbi:hypothetical protein B0T16DRAFT_224509 [Cercophora newfieldiana]|uniref:Uncharacterized protein n=1 Tax=Cercophora newfieldiana TaxID=92897 RepID=A0AA39XZ94_9PEZI|nr:hypothetical protein B0T16DRAFT_224509 [Cercophora newfieldiana]